MSRSPVVQTISNVPKVTHTKRTRVVLHVQDFPNETFVNDEPIVHCHPCEKPVSTSQRGQFIIFYVIKMTAIFNRKNVIDYAFINFQVKYIFNLKKNIYIML